MSFFLYLVYLALSYVRPDSFFPWVASLRPMLVLGLIALLFGTLYAIGQRTIGANRRHMVLLAVLIVMVGVSQIFTGGAASALESEMTFLPSAVVVLLAAFNLTDLKRIKAASAVIVVCMSLLCLLSIDSYYTGFMADELVLGQGAGDEGQGAASKLGVIPAEDSSPDILWRIRSVGFLRDPNDFAQAALVALCLAFSAYAPRRRMRTLFLVLLPSALFLFTIYLTHSRGAIIGLGAILLLGAREKLGNLKTGVLLAVLGAGVVMSDFAGGRGFSSQEASAQDRIDMWDEGIHAFASNPLLGVGFNNFPDTFGLTAHNSFVLCFTELGAIGFFAWMGLLVLAYRDSDQIVRLAPPESEERRWAQVLRASLVGFLACSWFLSRTYTPDLYVVVSLCIAMGYCGRKMLPQPRPNDSGPWVKLTLAACATILIGVYGFVLVNRFGGH